MRPNRRIAEHGSRQRKVNLLIVAASVAVLFWTSAAQAIDWSAEAAFEGPVPEADCGPGSSPETRLQGQVPLADRESGRSTQGYHCNLELLGQFQGEGSSWVSQSYGDCAYLSTRNPSQADSPGVQVIDVSDPANPRRTTALTSPAMRGTWESLKVNEARGLLAAVYAPEPGGNGVAFFDVYDIRSDCTRPRLLNSIASTELSIPANVLGHEGNWSPDGKTYWAAGLQAGVITAIDVANTSEPKIVYTGSTGLINHGLSVSDDGNRLYIAEIGNLAGAFTGGAVDPGDPNGVKIFDVSQVQARRLAPQITPVGATYWEDGAIGQHAIAVTYGGKPHLIFVDEGGAGAARIIDITDEGTPRVISKLKLRIHLPEYADVRAEDTAGTGAFGYEGHYCDVDRQTDPTALACGYFQSGVRVFDIRDAIAPREIAYFNPPAQTGREADLGSSEHASPALGGALTADWCSSPPRFVGTDQLWVTCQDNGFLALRFTNHAYPLLRHLTGIGRPV
ncbi:MAG: LVIVD repeat-containing protein [Micromonosporaceae bacterium]